MMSKGRANDEPRTRIIMSPGRAKDAQMMSQDGPKGMRPSRSYYQNLAQRGAKRETESLTRRPVAARA